MRLGSTDSASRSSFEWFELIWQAVYKSCSVDRVFNDEPIGRRWTNVNECHAIAPRSSLGRRDRIDAQCDSCRYRSHSARAYRNVWPDKKYLDGSKHVVTTTNPAMASQGSGQASGAGTPPQGIPPTPNLVMELVVRLQEAQEAQRQFVNTLAAQLADNQRQHDVVLQGLADATARNTEILRTQKEATDRRANTKAGKCPTPLQEPMRTGRDGKRRLRPTSLQPTTVDR